MVGVDCIFLSYRRRQSEWPTLRLRDRLVSTFGTERIFADVDSIELGQDFSKALEAALGSCRVLLAVIGQDWANACDAAGRRRLENPHDWVRVEIETALRRPNVLVIPVLIDGATMPPIEQLPGELAQLSLRQGVDLDAGGFTAQVEALIVTLQKILAQPPVQPPPLRFPVPGPAPAPAPAPVLTPPVAFTDYPVLPEDLQWAGPLTGNVIIEHYVVCEGAWVKIGDPLVVLRSEGGSVTLWSTYIGRITTLYYQNGQSLVQGRPLLAVAVSGWLFRVNFRMPFDTGVLLTSGVPSRKLDATGTASRLMVSVDHGGNRPVPWRTNCLLYVPPGSHMLSAIYEQPGSSFKAVSEIVKIRNGKRIAMTYEAPHGVGRSGKLRSALTT